MKRQGPFWQPGRVGSRWPPRQEGPPSLSCCHPGSLGFSTSSAHRLFPLFFLKDLLPDLSLNLSATREPTFLFLSCCWMVSLW